MQVNKCALGSEKWREGGGEGRNRQQLIPHILLRAVHPKQEAIDLDGLRASQSKVN